MTHKILFVVAHPDDESLWIGGILNLLAQQKAPESNLRLIDPYVICLTGKGHPHRFKEFKAAMKVVGIKNWFIGDEDIPSTGGERLVDSDNSFQKGVESLGLEPEEIDLLVTHPFYGDEHKHHQHIQLFVEMRFLCAGHKIPFGFFSTTSLPYFKLTPLHGDMRRAGQTHLINYCECEGEFGGVCPTHFFQFKVDSKVKDKMLKCYKSIDQAAHKDGYASWDNYVEGIYTLDAKGANIFESLYKNLETPAIPNLLLSPWVTSFEVDVQNNKIAKAYLPNLLGHEANWEKYHNQFFHIFK